MAVRITLDSNILISAFVFGGKPSHCLDYIVKKKVAGIVSPAILAETLGVLAAKFSFSPPQLEEASALLDEFFEKVYPGEILNISRDPEDNRVLEAAAAGDCDYIVTGDLDLLDLKSYRNIPIVTPAQFLNQFSS